MMILKIIRKKRIVNFFGKKRNRKSKTYDMTTTGPTTIGWIAKSNQLICEKKIIVRFENF